MDFLLLVSQGAAVYFSSVVAGEPLDCALMAAWQSDPRVVSVPGMQIASFSNALSIPYVSGVVDET